MEMKSHQDIDSPVLIADMSCEPSSAIPQIPPFAKWPEGAEPQTFKGRCHCEKFSYEFQHPSLDVKKPLSCNCSFCSRTGTINMFACSPCLS